MAPKTSCHIGTWISSGGVQVSPHGLQRRLDVHENGYGYYCSYNVYITSPLGPQCRCTRDFVYCHEREPCNRAADSYQVAWWRVRDPLEICIFRWIGYYDTQSPLLMIFLTFHGPLRNMHFFDKSATMTPKARSWPILWFFMAPFEEGQFGHRFHFLQLFKTF